MSSSSVQQRYDIRWTRLEPKPDPVHGIPCERSSHGLSIVLGGGSSNTTTTQSSSSGATSRLVLYGGEHVARTPVDSKTALWYVEDVDSCDGSSCWKCIIPTTTTDASLQSSSSLPPRPADRIAHGQCIYKNRYMYIFGGRSGIAIDESVMDDMWMYDTQTQQWIEIISNTSGDVEEEKPVGRSYHCMCCIDDDIYVFGGCGISGRLNDLYRFHIPTLTWHSLGTSKLRGRGGSNLLPIVDDGTKKALFVVAGFCGEETSDGQIYHIGSSSSSDTLDKEHGHWDEAVLSFSTGMRPRSVCSSGSIFTIPSSSDAEAGLEESGVIIKSSSSICILFGGEVDPSEIGHSGAGNFENDVVIFGTTTGNKDNNNDENNQQRSGGSAAGMIVQQVIPEDKKKKIEEGEEFTSSSWPQCRGWASGCTAVAHDNVGEQQQQQQSNGTAVVQVVHGHFYLFGGLTGNDENPKRLNDLWRLDIVSSASSASLVTN